MLRPPRHASAGISDVAARVSPWSGSAPVGRSRARSGLPEGDSIAVVLHYPNKSRPGAIGTTGDILDDDPRSPWDLLIQGEAGDTP